MGDIAMNSNTPADDFIAEHKASLELPLPQSEASARTSAKLDEFLIGDERQSAELMSHLDAHREAGLADLRTLKIKERFTFDPDLFRWPPSLFIPKDANARDYWISAAPDDHRYAIDWTAPPDATANTASAESGQLFTFTQLLNETAGSGQSSESGLGVFYSPSMSLGVVDFQPHVDCTGTLRTFLEFFPQLAAGYVEVSTQLMLAAWQVIPGGFDLLSWKSFDVATSGRRDQSHGPEEHLFQKSFAGPGLSAPFVVQRGRTYLFGVIGRVVVRSTLTTNEGRPLPAISSKLLRVWGSMSCSVPQIDVITARVDIP